MRRLKRKFRRKKFNNCVHCGEFIYKQNASNIRHSGKPKFNLCRHCWEEISYE
jgi:ribosomal protein S14